MVVISALNGVIANQLLRMFREAEQDNRVCIVGGNPTILNVTVEPNRAQSLRHGVIVLRAVVIAFVVCWLPYHARRLMFCYISDWSDNLYDFYHYFYMLTNVLFYVSSAINPILYNLVSATYRQIFFSTLRYFCIPCRYAPRRHAHPLTRHSISISMIDSEVESMSPSNSKTPATEKGRLIVIGIRAAVEESSMQGRVNEP
ncbi:Neurotensin receptor type 1 [Larimichthys crocea]|uniref:Uncharacterized protein n=1 Tax=Larimichthys crocea TaxID=215358 RepID=A0ACD3R962_LARCR|nr:Neurotensin receptor type 1 [Larimichthys crocea]